MVDALKAHFRGLWPKLRWIEFTYLLQFLLYIYYGFSQLLFSHWSQDEGPWPPPPCELTWTIWKSPSPLPVHSTWFMNATQVSCLLDYAKMKLGIVICKCTISKRRVKTFQFQMCVWVVARLPTSNTKNNFFWNFEAISEIVPPKWIFFAF